ncbi:MAG TPA: DUF1992 domain-containing protein [Jiangellaceae bacterium]
MGWRTSDGGAFGGTYESWIDKQIRDAEERGDFDDLPGKGEPLKNPSRPDDPDWWIKQKVAEEGLDLSAAMPLPLQLRKEAQGLPERIVRERSESAVRAVVEDFNERVRASWRQSFAGLPVQAQLADVDELLEHWRAERTARKAAADAAPQPAPEQPRPPGFVRRALLRLARKPPWST